MISKSPPFPPEFGANQRTYHFWKALEEIAPVDVILSRDPFSWLNDESPSPTTFNLAGNFPWRGKAHWLYRFLKKPTPSPALERGLSLILPGSWDYRVDSDVARRVLALLSPGDHFLAVGRYLKPIVKTGLVGRFRCLLDIDDLDFDIFEHYSKDRMRPLWQRILYTIRALQIKMAFERWVPRFDGLWVCKASDAQYAFSRNASILPNIPCNVPGVFAPIKDPGSKSPVILTVGFVRFDPIRSGIDRFIREGWPRIRAVCPEAQYWVAGNNDPATAERWEKVPGVRVLGFVADLAAIYEQIWFTLCPVWAGSGTNIKVLESLAFGRTCVSTVVGQRGFEDKLRSGDSILVGVDSQGLAENCVRLIENQQQMHALAERGRTVVQREFSYETFARIVHREIEFVLRSRRPES